MNFIGERRPGRGYDPFGEDAGTGREAVLDALAEEDDDDGPTDHAALDPKSDAAPSSPRTQRPSRPR